MYIKISKCEFDFLYDVFKSYFSLYKFRGKVKFIFTPSRIVTVVYLWYFFTICLVIVTFRHVFNNKITNYHDMREFLLYHLFYTFIEPTSTFIKKAAVCYRIAFCFPLFNTEKLMTMKLLVAPLAALIWAC